MDYLIELINGVIDKLNEAKGFVLGKKLLEEKPKPVFKNNVIKFKDLQKGREASTNKKEERVDARMNKKPTLGSIKKLKNKDLYRGRFQYKGIVYTTTAKKFIDCFNKHEAKIKEVMAEYESTLTTNKKIGFDKNTLLKDWYDYWYKTYKENDLKQSTKMVYETFYNAYLIKSGLFKLKLGKITTFDIQELINGVKSNSSKKRVKIHLNACFQLAIDTGILTFNPVKATAIPKDKKTKQKKTLNKDQLDKIFNYCKNPDGNQEIYLQLHDLYFLMLHSGLRIGEALALTWDNIDLDNKLIKVRRTYHEITKTFSTPKTETSIRDIPIFDELKKMLESKSQESDLLFNVFIGKPTKDYAKMISNKIGVKFTNHMFRHTFASNCIAKGINPKTVQKWLGHTELDMTMNVYVDVLDELEKSDIDKYND